MGMNGHHDHGSNNGTLYDEPVTVNGNGPRHSNGTSAAGGSENGDASSVSAI